MRDKRGQLSNLTGIIATLVVVGILIGVGFLVMAQFLEQPSFKSAASQQNEFPAYINATGYNLSAEKAGKTTNFVITSARNTTNETGGVGQGYNLTILAANYTVNAATGMVTNATTTTFGNVSFNYTYSTGAEGWQGVNDTVGAMGNIPSLLGIIVLVAVVGIVLAVVFNVVPGARSGGA